ncbi:derepression protein [Escherichia coli]|uniref:derepression protein n=1 Tax=Escherichia coli TaxID=562 RepID=UPI00107996B2|nr:derepression protein [Escherichia coli]MCN4958196.1 derepression protein [Escherichia coli]
MANRKQQRARTERRHIQTEINRRLYRAITVARVMYFNMLCDQGCQIAPDYIASTFSYLADDLRDMQRLVNDQAHNL